MKLRDTLLAVFVMWVWGLNFVIAKLGLTQFPPIFLIAVRFTVVALLLVWFVPPPRGRLRQVAALALVLGGLHFSLMFTGLKGVEASIAALAIQLQVPFSVLLAAVVFRERVRLRHGIGMLTAFAGILCVAGAPQVSPNLGSLALVVCAALVWSIAAMQIKAMGPMNGFVLNAWLSLLAAPQLFLASALLEHGQWHALTHARWAGWGAVAYMAIMVTVVGYGAWYGLLARHPVNQVMPFTLLVPVFGVLGGVVFLHDPLTWQIVLGGLLTVVGVGILVLRRPRLRARAAEAREPL